MRINKKEKLKTACHAAFFIVSIAVAVSFGGCKKKEAGSLGKSLAPNLILQVAGENKNWELKPFLGKKTVLIAFFTTWCPYCKQSMPYIENFYRQNKNKDFEVVGVDLEEPSELAVNFSKKYGLTFPVLLGSQSTSGSFYPVRFLPTLYLIGKDGTLIKTFEGFHPSVFEEVNKELGG